MSPLGLYVHIPFCSSICPYCNFNRSLFDTAVKRRYLGALEQEIREAGDARPARARRADTLFLGGGTPSLLEPREVDAIVGACRDSFDLDAGAEVTLEINPENADEARLAGFRAAGVTRLSFGVQSFRDDELRRLGRIHDASRPVQAIGLARAAGFVNVSLDLMMWLPQQTVAQWEESVSAATSLGPEHISFYLLELYPNAPLREEMARAGWSLAPDEEAAAMYLRGLECFEAAGYEPYEISNVAQPGKRCRHNLKYWTDGEWRGFGCGAHSTIAGVRWKNVAGIGEYIARLEAGGDIACEHRRLSALERAEEALFTGLRLYEGIDLDEFRRSYGIDVWERYGERLIPYIDAGLLLGEDHRLRLTRPGMLLANEVLAVFV